MYPCLHVFVLPMHICFQNLWNYVCTVYYRLFLNSHIYIYMRTHGSLFQFFPQFSWSRVEAGKEIVTQKKKKCTFYVMISVRMNISRGVIYIYIFFFLSFLRCNRLGLHDWTRTLSVKEKGHKLHIHVI